MIISNLYFCSGSCSLKNEGLKNINPITPSKIKELIDAYLRYQHSHATEKWRVIYTFSNKKDNAQQADKAIAETTKFILDEFSKKNICFSATDFK